MQRGSWGTFSGRLMGSSAASWADSPCRLSVSDSLGAKQPALNTQVLQAWQEDPRAQSQLPGLGLCSTVRLLCDFGKLV